MPLTIEPLILISAVLVMVGVLASRVSDRFGIPLLLMFLGVGMLAGSDGIGGIYFDNANLSQQIGMVALAVILFAGGLDTRWKDVKPIAAEAGILATLGVFLTAALTALAARFILRLDWMTSALIGAIVSSTDAAAVFSILRAKGVRLVPRMRYLLEFESGSNDPMAIFLTVTLLSFSVNAEAGIGPALFNFLKQMLIGGGVGLLMGFFSLWMINRLKLGYDGLYPVLALALVFITFSVTAILGGSGYLAVYLAGLVLGSHEFLHKNSLTRFFDGMSWLMQAVLFLVLGLLVFPSRLVVVALPALAVAVVLMAVARPLTVWLCLIPFRVTVKEKLMIAWTGLRGAVPVVLATYPYQAGVESADLIFDVVFFVVLTSALLQGSGIAWVARKLGLEAPPEVPVDHYPVKLTLSEETPSAGHPVYELGLPEGFQLMWVERNGDVFRPDGTTVLLRGDTIQGLTTPEAEVEICQKLSCTAQRTG